MTFWKKLSVWEFFDHSKASNASIPTSPSQEHLENVTIASVSSIFEKICCKTSCCQMREKCKVSEWSNWRAPASMNLLGVYSNLILMTRRAFSPSSKSNTGTVGASCHFPFDGQIYDFFEKIERWRILWQFKSFKCFDPHIAITRASRKCSDCLLCKHIWKYML